VSVSRRWEAHKREDGANPSRSRRCNRGRLPHDAILAQFCEEKARHKVDPEARRPADTPSFIRVTSGHGCTMIALS